MDEPLGSLTGALDEAMQDALRDGWIEQSDFFGYTRSEDRGTKERFLADLIARMMRAIQKHEQKANEIKPILDRLAQNLGQ